MNNPFTATYTTITDENSQTTEPKLICNQSVFVTQNKHRKMYDSLTTSINGISNQNYPFQNRPNDNIWCGGGNFQVPAQKTLIPNGVMFTFNLCNYPQISPPNYSQFPITTPQPRDLGNQINLNQIHLQRALDSLNPDLRFTVNRPAGLRFHLDAQNSTSDLLNAGHQTPISQGMADFGNLSGVEYAGTCSGYLNFGKFPQPAEYNKWNVNIRKIGLLASCERVRRISSALKHRKLTSKNCKITKLKDSIIDELEKGKNVNKKRPKEVKFSLKEKHSKTMSCQTDHTGPVPEVKNIEKKEKENQTTNNA